MLASKRRSGRDIRRHEERTVLDFDFDVVASTDFSRLVDFAALQIEVRGGRLENRFEDCVRACVHVSYQISDLTYPTQYANLWAIYTIETRIF